MRKLATMLGLLGVAVLLLAPGAGAQPAHKGKHRGHHGSHGKKAKCGRTDRQGYVSIFDGTRRCFERWRYAGGSRSRSSATAR